MKLFRYAGSKDKYLDLINSQIIKSKKKIYIEPFLGSGSIFLNLPIDYDKYILNDLDGNIIKIFQTVKESPYINFIKFVELVKKKFGDIKENKSAYYSFRDNFNQYLYNKYTPEEGFGLLLLYSSCINSLARFGPNGFNQSYGHRFFIPDENTWNITQQKLLKTTIYNLDFLVLIQQLETELSDSLLFLDPPYFYGGKVGYDSISKDWYQNYLQFLEHTTSDVIYTDILHQDLTSKWYSQIFRTMRNISPNRQIEFTKEEVMYYNF